MTVDPQMELRQIVGELRATLEAQQQLGLEYVDARWPEGPAPARPMTLEEVRQEMGECTRCKLHRHRTQIEIGRASCRERV